MVAVLDDYVAGQLQPVYQRDLDEHIRGCRDCEAFLDTYRTTIALTGQLRCEEIPKELLDKLREIATRIAAGNGRQEP